MGAVPEERHEIHCAEVHGGNLAVDQALVLPDVDVWLYSRPQGEGEEGGDLVFVSVCERGAVSKAYLGDVAGHGEAVGPVARSLEGLIREHLNDHDHQAFFRSLNRGVDPKVLATMVAVSWDRPSGRLLYAYAGHPHLLFRPAGAERFVSLEPEYCAVPGKLTDLAIGADAGTTYFQSGVPFEPGDMAVLYSDGWTETLRASGERPGLDGLLAVADRCSVASAWSFRRDLLRIYREDLGVKSFSDDVSLVVLKRL